MKTSKTRPFRSFSVFLLAVAFLVVGATPRSAVAADQDEFFGEGQIEAFTGLRSEEVEEVDDGELDGMRGGFMGMLVSGNVINGDGSIGTTFAFSNLGDRTGNFRFESIDPSNPAVEGGGIGGGVNVTNTMGEALRVTSIENSFTSGISIVSQVPGNNNQIYQNLTINIALLNVTPQNLAAVRYQLGKFFGR